MAPIAFRKRLLSTVFLLALAGGCSGRDKDSAPPPVPVDVETIRTQVVPNIFEIPGRIVALRTAEVRARTDGIVIRRLYEEGSDVAAGTPLFLIDQRDNRAQVQAAEGTLHRAQAARENAAAVVGRYKPLIAERAVSGQEYDSARSELRQAEAQVQEAQAALARSKLQLEYTVVRAPIAGRVGRAEVTEGALVAAGQGTLMTRIDQASPVHAVFSESSAMLLDMFERYRKGELVAKSMADVKVHLTLENGTPYAQDGRIDFRDTVVDPETGSQTIRARFDNPARQLVPGQFVTGRIEAGVFRNGIAVPTKAIQFRGPEASVSILGKDGTVSARPVTVGALVGKKWIIESGLKPGDKVIVDGWQKVRPGQKATARQQAQPQAQAQAQAQPQQTQAR